MSLPIWTYLQGLNSFGGDFGISLGALHGGGAPASSGFPEANLAIFVPVYANQSYRIKRLFCVNGGTVSGNVDVGIYTRDGTRISSSTSTAQSGTSVPQFFNVTDLMIGPGAYYMAVAIDNITATLLRSNIPISRLKCLGVARQQSAFPLPANAVFASFSDSFLPVIGAEIGELR